VFITTAEVSVAISLAALGTAVYGIFERGNAAKRAERVRLTTIVEDLAKIRGEIVELVSKGITAGDQVEQIHGRMELLAQQALSLVQAHHLTITSSEYREIAIGLEEAGFTDNAHDMFLLAREHARAEGEVQELYANRAYAYFLFRTQRADEARTTLREALSRYPQRNDLNRMFHANTLRIWLQFELEADGPQSPRVAELGRQIDELINACSTSRGRTMTSAWAYSNTDIPGGQPNIG
jgi:hypothetical protein